MNNDDVPYVTACFRCGTILPPFETDPSHAVYKCECCGERGVITIRQALDIINDHVLTKEVNIEELTEEGYDYG